VRIIVIALVLISASAASAQTPSPASCGQLASLSIANTTITRAQSVAAGAFTPPAPAGAPVATDVYKTLPAFCRVEAAVRRAGETDVKIEVWLPAQNWNGEFRPAAGGFAGGAITYASLADQLRQGWATAGTNRGHDGGGPWIVADMTSVPYHLMIAPSKALIDRFYGKAPALTLMNECGGGGSRDALQLVQDHPADLDAAAAVGFVYDALHHGVAQMWVFQATHKSAASYIPPAKYPLIHQAAINACDAKDGVRDGVIEDPPRCSYDVSVLACKAGEGADCLTPPQIEAVKQIYSPVVHARTGRYLFAGMPPGGELGWEPMAGPAPYGYAPGFYRNAVFRDQTWDWKNGLPNFDADVDRAEAPANQPINAMKADISPFLDRGGKLLLIGGWNDHTLAPGSFVDYYQAVVKAVGPERARRGVRLFMVPGMDHCLNTTTYGALHEFDASAALRTWKATGRAPDQIEVAVHKVSGGIDKRRLVCSYPQVASYNGRGSTADPASFSCKSP
jgi:feruloyl esterase